MAITGTKAFTSGEILTSNDVNQYLMRGVKVFSSAAVRDAAYGGAGEPVLEEGETCYVTADDELQVYDGSNWVPFAPKANAGKVLQVVSTTKTDTFSTSSTSFVDVTGMNATITPSAASSKVLVIVQASWGLSANNAVLMRMTGGNSASYVGDVASNRSRAIGQVFVASGTQGEIATLVYLDSPNTTSSTVYQLQAHCFSTFTAFLNRTGTDTDNSGFYRWASSVTVMEISA